MKITTAKKQRRAEMIQRYDRDRNGSLDKAEKQALRSDRRAARKGQRYDHLLGRLDQNQDGALSWAEVSAADGQPHPRLQERFRQADANNDGVLTRAELEQAAPAARGKK